MLSGRRIGRIGDHRSGLILGSWASRRVQGLNRSACLDILLRLLFVAFALSHARCCARVRCKTVASKPARRYGLELLLRSGS